MPHHAAGSFTVKLQPSAATATDGWKRFSMEKHFQGSLEGTSAGEMIAAGDPKTGEAGYVAIETVTGKLDGKKGSFALQQFATMSGGGQKLEVTVTPGSGTGELAGIAGTFTIQVANGQHSYTLDYTLPESHGQ